MNNYSEIDTISLLDIWHLLVKRKILFFTVFLLILITGSIFTITRAPQYDYTQLVELPNYLAEENLVSLWPYDLVVKKIKQLYFPVAVAKYNASHVNEKILLKADSLDIEKIGDHYLSFSVKGTTKNKNAYKEIFQMVLNDIKTETSAIIESKINFLKKNIENLQKQKNNIIQNEELLKNDKVNKSNYAILLLHNMHINSLITIDQKILDLNYKISSSHLLTASDLFQSIYPVGPSKKIVWFLFFLMGLMMGFFIVLAVEFVCKTKSQKS